MSEASRGSVPSAENSNMGPDYFGFYTREVAELFSDDDDFLTFSSQTSDLYERVCSDVRDGIATKHSCNAKEANSNTSSDSLFSNGIGAGFSDFKKERLKALLRQSVDVLTAEVDEMSGPVIAMRRLQLQLRDQKCVPSSSSAATVGDAEKFPHEKFKMPSSSSSTNPPAHPSPDNCGYSREGSGSKHLDSKLLDVALSEKENTHDVKKKCAHCQTAKTPQWRTGPEGKYLCNACGIKYKKKTDSLLGSNEGAEKENGEVDKDLQFFLENNRLLVDETVKKYYDGLCASLGHMEQKLEELLDTVMSKCRPMTLTEKQQLQKLIQKLPQKNLDCVAEIIRRSKPSETQSCDEIVVDLEKVDNGTLWRLYYYAGVVERARRLTMQLNLNKGTS